MSAKEARSVTTPWELTVKNVLKEGFSKKPTQRPQTWTIVPTGEEFRVTDIAVRKDANVNAYVSPGHEPIKVIEKAFCDELIDLAKKVEAICVGKSEVLNELAIGAGDILKRARGGS